MSGFGGVCQWDGQPVAADRLDDLSSQLNVAGPDSNGTVQPVPWLALQSHVLHFDRLSSSERQPYVFARGCVLSWDGRLDNREDLLLTLHRELGTDQTDAAIVAAAYERWGLDALPRLIGDWCLAIWDAQQERLVLALDYMGNRALYYHVEHNRLAWATRLEALAACEQLFDAPDDLYIAGFLSKVGNPSDVTPFVGLTRLLGGHVLVANRHGATVRRYWTFSPATLRYKELDRYAEHLRALVMEGVRVRLRSNRTVWAHLSGGWDSSTVVCIAQRLIARGVVEAPCVQPLSVVYDDIEASKEREFMAAVEEWCGLTTTEVAFHAGPMYADMAGHRVPFAGEQTFDMDAPAQRAGDRIVLTGSLGDFLMGRVGGAPLALSQPFDDGHRREALRRLIEYAGARKRPLAKVLAEAISRRLEYRQLWPRKPSVRIDQLVARREPGYEGVPVELLTRAHARPRMARPVLTDFPPTVRPLVDGLYSHVDRGSAATPEFITPVVWTTHPYSHRPLIEFLVAVPAEALFDARFARAGQRRAMAEILPPAILARSTKIGIPETSFRRCQERALEQVLKTELLSEPAEEWCLVKRGAVVAAKLAHDLRATRAGSKPSKFLNKCIYLEAWLRSLTEHTHTSTRSSAAHIATRVDVAVATSSVR